MKEAATKALMCFDTDGNGLDQTEFTEALQAFRFNRDSKKMRDTISNIFAKCDVDGNGRLTAKELTAGLPTSVLSRITKKLEAGWAFDPAVWATPSKAATVMGNSEAEALS
ncbi:hypothetical protein EMIHUDRAFT_243312 [Emiliania huxleyi CCMP1516]|uniref:EF-hand domain-containing protein n=2 Tax=Emiliania huxleyi TaxID=2903 RepID=A0A0D3J6E9_EMIH1|nr:hypothetical protein EMIHUDRAFT_243312 [Emiliania huxleyi CCMP1516]EOD19084.1 hypothetical protein EMIHUDRAFT_243312 [Emiliania huxleyi CCMP1516]|eukprot:XP_005771513.1 hypothetical protein EMIHUDRAFT_243312 [Emiliania huxleyi CCMP1516]